MHPAVDNTVGPPSFIGENGVSLANVQDKPNVTSEQTTTFIDSENAAVDVPMVRDRASGVISYADQSIADFLSRPVMIYSNNWSVGTDLNDEVEIWDALVSNAAVKRKLANYTYFNATINIKLVFNFTPFHYSHIIASYTPNPGFNANHVIDNALSTKMELTKASLLPNIIFDPNTTSAVQMSFPLLTEHNYVNLQDFIATDALTQGSLNIHSTAPLRVASPSASNNISFSVYAWLTNVQLSIPTDYNVAASQKVRIGVQNAFSPSVVPNKASENRNGLVSSVSAVIANAAGALSDHPKASTYLQSINNAAGAISNVAQYFGYSRPTVLTDRLIVKNTPLSPLAVSGGPETVTKLALDPLQGVSASSEVLGVDIPIDELSILSIAQRPTLMHTSPWNTTFAGDTVLTCFNVNPVVANYEFITANTTAIQFSALTHACYPFGYWSGSLKLRMKIVCSQYHRGRLRISYNPTVLNPPSLFFPANTQFSQIVDISEENDIEIIIPWAQKEAYRPIHESISAGFSDSIVTPLYDYGYNGQVIISVVSSLTAPDTSADVSINYYLSAGDDFEVAGFDENNYLGDIHARAWPGALPAAAKPEHVEPALAKVYEAAVPSLSGKKGSEPESVDEFVAASELVSRTLFGESTSDSVIADKKAQFFGEVFDNFRPLLKRYSDQGYRFGERISPLSQSGLCTIVSTIYPLFRGFQLPSFIAAENWAGYEQATVSGVPYAYSSVDTSLIPYLGSAFYAYRGSMRWKVIPVGSYYCPVNHVSVYRGNALHGNNTHQWHASVAPSSTGTPSAFIYNYNFDDGLQNLMGAESQPVISGVNGLEFEMPYYNDRRYSSTSVNFWGSSVTANQANEVFSVKMVTAQAPQTTNYIRMGYRAFCAAGEDFSLLMYLGPPLFFENTGTLTHT